MKIVLLDTLTFGDTSLERFNTFGVVDIYKTTSKEETQERILNANVIVTNKVVITKEMMQNAQDLKLICIAATGMNNVDLVAAKELGIEVKNVAGYSTNSVIQHTFSMLFYLIGHSRYYDEVVKSGIYSSSAIFTDVSQPFFEVAGKKWGIIGLGAIGRGVANVASAFGAEVSYYSTSGIKRVEEFESVSLLKLLAESDIISIHAPLNELTQNLLDYPELNLCKNGAVILNLGRGGIINEDAVAKIIDEKELMFGLDVLTQEPMRKDHPLLAIEKKENLYITPHIAWTSKEAREKLLDSIVQNIKESF